MFREDLKEHPVLFGLLAVVLLSGFIGLGAVALTDVDEAVFAEASREMLEQGDWITPTYNYAPRYDKPVFFYWVQAASFSMLGVNEYAARLPSAIACFLLTVGLYFFIRRHLKPRVAVWSTVSWLLCVESFVYGHAGVTDMTLSLFLFGALAGVFNYLQEPGQRRWLRLAYVSAALAFLTKGLIGVVFPVAIAVLFLLVQRRFKPWKLWDATGVLLFLGIALPWYTAQTIRDGGAFLEAFFWKHHLKRYADVVSGHEGPWYYFLGVMSVGFFPWLGFIPAGFLAAFRNRTAELARYSTVWFLFIFIFFSFSGTKLPNYILSALPAASILAGVGMDALLETKKKRAASGAITVILLIALTLGVFVGKFWYGVSQTEYPTIGIVGVLIALGGITLWCLWCLFRGALQSLLVLPAALLLMLGSATIFVAPILIDLMQGELKTYAEEVRREGKDTLAVFRLNKPSLVFYFRGKVEKFQDVEQLSRHAGERTNLKVVAAAKPWITQALLEAGFGLHREGRAYHVFAFSGAG